MKKVIILFAVTLVVACSGEHKDDHKKAASKTVNALEQMGGKAKGAAHKGADHAAKGTKGAMAKMGDAAKAAGSQAAGAASALTGAAAAAGDAATGAAAAAGDAAKGAAAAATGAAAAAGDAVKGAADSAKGMVVDAKAMAEAKTVFTTRCVACHGSTGKGDGAAAAALKPKPRAYNDKAWQKTVTDSYLAKVIVKGGAAVGKSPLMPGNADLEKKPEVVKGLVSIIRGFAK